MIRCITNGDGGSRGYSYYKLCNLLRIRWKYRFSVAASCAMASDKNQHEEGEVKSSVVKRSIIIAAQKTSVSLEDAFWGA